MAPITATLPVKHAPCMAWIRDNMALTEAMPHTHVCRTRYFLSCSWCMGAESRRNSRTFGVRNTVRKAPNMGMQFTSVVTAMSRSMVVATGPWRMIYAINGMAGNCRRANKPLPHFSYMPAAGHCSPRIENHGGLPRDPRPESKLISAQGIFHSMQKDTNT